MQAPFRTWADLRKKMPLTELLLPAPIKSSNQFAKNLTPLRIEDLAGTVLLK